LRPADFFSAIEGGSAMLYSKVIVRVLAACGTAAMGTGPAIASPGNGVSAENFVPLASLQDEAQINHDRVKLQTKEATAVRVQRLTFAPGAFTGWHHHPGAVIVTIASGSVTLTDGACQEKTYGPGSPNGNVFIEGHDDGHQASSAGGAVVYVTYISPDGTFRVEDPAQTCP
jgi:quercetin dioxygenase-like cupin family protein